jgi:hypothetical protein
LVRNNELGFQQRLLFGLDSRSYASNPFRLAKVSKEHTFDQLMCLYADAGMDISQCPAIIID